MKRKLPYIVGILLVIIVAAAILSQPRWRARAMEWLDHAKALIAHSSTTAGAHDHDEAEAGSPELLITPLDRVARDQATAGAFEALETPPSHVELAGDDVAERMGFEYREAETRRFAASLSGNAEIQYNANLYAEVRPRINGLVREVLVDEGSHVHAGDPMIVIDSAEVGTAKANYLEAIPNELLARQMLDMTLSLRKTNSAPLKDEMEARATYNTERAQLLQTRQALLNLGYTPENLDQFARVQDSSNLHRVIAPIDGYVVERHAVSGEAVEANHKLFGVADTRLMWAWIDVYEERIDDVTVGQSVTFTLFGAPTERYAGKVDWVDAAVNPETRTIRVRAEIGNSDGQLRANQFGRATIQTGTESEVIIVPRAAVQTVHGQDVVFVPIDAKTFETHPLAWVRNFDAKFARVGGLAPGTKVVTAGSFLLKSDLLKTSIAGHEH